MARYTDLFHRPKTEITIYQQTIHDLENNTITKDFFETFKKAIEEGYHLKFVSFGDGDDNETLVKTVDHLKNYINHIQKIKMLN